MPFKATKSKLAGIALRRFVILSIGLSAVSCGSDPCGDGVLAFVRASPELAAELGRVQNIGVHKKVIVEDAISVDDQFVPGYRSYHLTVKGSKANALVTVRTGLKDCSATITSIDKG